MSLETVADYLAKSRELLQDKVEPYRYGDDTLVDSLNTAIMEARRIRPDLWLSTFRSSLPSYDESAPTDVVDIDPMYRMAFVYYMCGQAQLSDQEDTEDQRAVAFLGKFAAQLNNTQA